MICLPLRYCFAYPFHFQDEVFHAAGNVDSIRRMFDRDGRKQVTITTFANNYPYLYKNIQPLFKNFCFLHPAVLFPCFCRCFRKASDLFQA